MHFIAYYEGEIICGKPLGEADTGWNSLPDKSIRKLEYINSCGDNVVLEDYDEYTHFIEVVQRMGEKPYATRIFLMGAKDGKVTVHKIMLDKERLGQVVTKECVRGKEYDEAPSWGWRKGIETQRHGGTED